MRSSESGTPFVFLLFEERSVLTITSIFFIINIKAR
jgi:hypothetical protein